MHPILASKGRIALYLAAWVPVAILLIQLVHLSGAATWGQTATFVTPLTAVFAFISLSPWYLCRALPFEPARIPVLVMHHGAAAIAGSLFWIVIAKGYVLLLARWTPQLNPRLSHELPTVFSVGLLIYMLAVAMHYAMLSFQTSREAEERAHEASLLAREAELKALKAQINPHFLFNSLNSISALATVDGVRAREMCVRLADFLRSTLSLGERETVPFAEELALTRTYLEVEQIRFGNRLHVMQQIDAECQGCYVPPLLLQPLIENAIKHGIAGLVEGGSIRMEAHCRHGQLWIGIENDFDAEAPAPRKSGLGLKNVRDRLRTRYENQARLDTLVRGECFLVEVTMPCGDRGTARPG